MKILRVENVREEGKRAAVYRGESFRLFASDAVLAWPMERRRLPKSAERAEGDRASATEIRWIRCTALPIFVATVCMKNYFFDFF